MIFSLLAPTLIKVYLKNKYLQLNEVFLARKVGMLIKTNFMIESLLFIGVGAGAGEKNTRSWSRLRNTDNSSTVRNMSQWRFFLILASSELAEINIYSKDNFGSFSGS